MNSTTATTTFHGPEGLFVKRGDVRPADDAVVRAYPQFFRSADGAPVVEAVTAAPGELRGSEAPTEPEGASEPVSEPVEAATAAPGETRTAKPQRPGKGKGGQRG